jgi:RNA polymerase sigma factor (sigma-70 family)
MGPSVEITRELPSKRRITGGPAPGAPRGLHGDAELLARYRRGDPGALAAVYRLYVTRVQRAVRRRLWRMGHAVPGLPECAVEEADLVQEVFARAFAPAARLRYDGLRDYDHYLFGIAGKLLADRARRRAREIPVDEAVLEAAAGPDEGLDHGPEVAILGLVKRYLAGLPEALRAVHHARHDRGLSQRQAAAWLGVTRQNLRTLESQLHTGLRLALSARRRLVVRAGDSSS